VGPEIAGKCNGNAGNRFLLSSELASNNIIFNGFLVARNSTCPCSIWDELGDEKNPQKNSIQRDSSASSVAMYHPNIGQITTGGASSDTFCWLQHLSCKFAVMKSSQIGLSEE